MNDESLASADTFLGEQRARGATRLRPGVEAAYRFRDPDRTLNVVVLPDGMTEEAEREQLLDLIRRRPATSSARRGPAGASSCARR